MNTDALRKGLVELLPRLRRYAYALTGAPADADDLVQSCVERILTKGVPPEVVLDRWTFRVCKNIWIDEYRALQRQKAYVEQTGIDHDEPTGDEVMMSRAAITEVNKAMEQLSDDQRAALSLVALEGFTYAEAAETLEVPIGTIMSRIARARKTLINLISDDVFALANN